MILKKNKYVLRKTVEGKVLFIGIILGLVFISGLGYLFFIDVEHAKSLFYAFLAHSLGGRAAGIGICIDAGYSNFIAITYNFFLEILIVFFAYSMFVMSIKNYITLRSVKYAVLKVMRKAYKYESKIQKYGWFGLFAFVMLPLPVTGPVVGSLLGYLLKFKTIKNFSAVFLGTLVAISVWVVFFDYLNAQLHIIRYILIGIVVLVVVSYIKTIVVWIKKKK